MTVIEISRLGFRVECDAVLPLGAGGRLLIELGVGRWSQVVAHSVRQATRGSDPQAAGQFGFKIDQPDAVWLECVRALESGQTHADLMGTLRGATQRVASAGEMLVIRPRSEDSLSLPA